MFPGTSMFSNQLIRLSKRYLSNIPCDFWWKTSLYICPKYGFADIKAQSIYRELSFDSSALNEAKVNYASYNTKAPYEHNPPLQAEIRKYPHSVTSLNAKCTTGLVCPLQVNGVCRKFAIFIDRNKTVPLRFVSYMLEPIDNMSINMIIEYWCTLDRGHRQTSTRSILTGRKRYVMKTGLSNFVCPTIPICIFNYNSRIRM